MHSNPSAAVPEPRCPNCGGPIPSVSPQGLCPKCLFAGLAEPTGDGSESTPRASSPTPQEIAPHFPQLEIIECLGRGGMGVVYKTRQKSLDRLVALKLLAPERVNDPQFAERFSREAKALAALNHPNIVTIHDFGKAGGFYFLLMEFVDGVNLRQAMKAGRFTPEQALAIVPPVCEALQFAHEHGIVHRDIKPENLLLDKDGRVKIADFGIAKMLNANDTDVGLPESQPAGTPQYMAPEQKAHRTTDHRADIYSLGVVLYEMLTGERPGAHLQPPSRRVQIDVRLDEIVMRALEVKPELRFQTAGEFRTHVETLTEESPGSNVKRRPKKSPLVTFLEITSSMEFTSPLATRLIHLSALGFLAALAFLGFVPLPGMQRCFGFSGFAGFFGLIGVAYAVEREARSGRGKPPSETDVTAPPSFSRSAIFGASWVPLFFLALVGMLTVSMTVPEAEVPRTAWWQDVLSFTLLPLGAIAPFATTILGWIAVSQIRRSTGRLYGMGLAVFDGLLFPLLAVDALFGVALGQVGSLIQRGTVPPFAYRGLGAVPLLPWFLGVVLIVIVDIFITRAVWRWVNRPGPLANEGGFNPKKSPAMLIAAVVAIAAGCLLGGHVLTWFRAAYDGAPNGGMLVMTVMPIKVIGRNVIVRVMTHDPTSPCEMRVVLEGPENSADLMKNGVPVMPTDLAESGFQGTFVTPRAFPGNQPWFRLSGSMNVDIAFSFPTPELAQQAFENVQASQPIDVISNIRRRHTIMEAIGRDGVHCTALVFISAPVREGDPKWVSINSVAQGSSGDSIDMIWELRTSRPGAVIRRYNYGVTGVMIPPEIDNRQRFKTTVRVVLYAMGPHRVRLEEWTGASHIDEEMDGDFIALAQEFRDSAYPGTIKTEREWETELCRIGGQPVTVQVTDEIEGVRVSRAPVVDLPNRAATLKPSSNAQVPRVSAKTRTFELRHMSGAEMVDRLRQILSGGAEQEAKASANDQEVIVTAPLDVMNRVQTFITASDWPDKIDRGPNYEYPRETVMHAARSFFLACAIEDDVEVFSKMLSPGVLAKLKGDTNSEAFLNYNMGGVPNAEWEKSLRGDWPGKKEAILRFLREWNRYPMKGIRELGGTAIGFGVKNFCTVFFEGAPVLFNEITIEPARGDTGTSQESYYFGSLPPRWELFPRNESPGTPSTPSRSPGL